MEEQTKTQMLKDRLFYSTKNVYQECSEGTRQEISDFADAYSAFLDSAKTEREAVKELIEAARLNGYTEYRMGERVYAGGKYYFNNRGKALALFAIGDEPIENGIRISIAHVDSPRIDLKQNPLYEEGEMAFFKTHYYGGIKKYQWTAIPLALHGVVVKENGESVEVKIGESPDDPVFYINDLLPHLAKDQMKKTMAEGISGEGLNLLVGSLPYPDCETDPIRLGILSILNEKYGITESDFLSAELSAVPAYGSRDIGFDRSLIGGYGHDDRVCAFSAFSALMDTHSPHTVMTVLADKEETGSEGNTGMQSDFFSDLIEEISKSLGGNPALVRANSKCLSADVNAAYDPNFPEVYEKKNTPMINHGVVLTKVTGSRGKSGTSDASAEFVGYVRSVFEREGIIWQTGELGRVDQGGGGTVAAYVACRNIDTVDIGVPVISMHAPYEVIAKADLYMAYRAFKAFNH